PRERRGCRCAVRRRRCRAGGRCSREGYDRAWAAPDRREAYRISSALGRRQTTLKVRRQRLRQVSKNIGARTWRLSDRTRVRFGAHGFDQFGEGFRAEVAFAAVAEADGAGFRFFGADDEHVGNFLELGVADFGGQLFVAVIEMDTDAVVLQGFEYVL